MIGLFLIAVAFLCYLWLEKRRNFWKNQKIPHIDGPILLGNIPKVFVSREHFVAALSRIYYHPNGKDQPMIGFNIAHKPAILVKDPELVKRIMIKDFDYFSNRFTGFDASHDPVGGNNLFQIKNPMWRIMRNKVNPVFTSGKMKQMFPIVLGVGDNFSEKIRKISENKKELNVRQVSGEFTLDSIALVALATETRSLLQDKPSDFLEMIGKAFFSSSLWAKISINSLFFFPELGKLLKLTSFTPFFNDTLTTLFHQVYKERIQSGATRGDLIDTLIALKKSEAGNKENFFSDEVLVSQAAVFILAGFETAATTIAFAVYELAKNPDVQSKLRNELKEELNKSNGQITYEMIAGGLPYMNQFFKETTRMYSSLPFLDRVCQPPNGGTHYVVDENLKIPAGTPVYIPIYCLQRDPQYFPEPEKFDPDRFDPTKYSVNEYTFMPFGTGPRMCIGERFGKMQVFMALAQLLRSFRVEVNASTPKKLTFDIEHLMLRSKENIMVTCVEDELYELSEGK